jgi:hypothetical protein
VIRETAKKVAPKLEALIDDFARKLDAWVVSAGQELHREVLEVLRATREARGGGHENEVKANEVVEGQAQTLAAVTERIEKLRVELWGIPSK